MKKNFAIYFLQNLNKNALNIDTNGVIITNVSLCLIVGAYYVVWTYLCVVFDVLCLFYTPKRRTMQPFLSKFLP